MIETIFKECVEVYSKTEMVTNKQPKVDWFLDEEATGDTLPYVTPKIVNTDLDGFKEALKANKQCGVCRETIVVEKNDEKNTIQIKRYWVNKNWRLVKNINVLKPVTIKRYQSLTIHLGDKSFSIYEAHFKNQKRLKATIRKDVVQSNTLRLIGEMFDFNLIHKNIGINILNILSNYLFCVDYFEHDEELIKNIKIVFTLKNEVSLIHRIKYFMLKLFLDKYRVTYNPYTMLNRAYFLKKDKKLITNGSFESYVAKTLKIDDVFFIKNIIQFNESMIILNKNKKFIDTQNSDKIIFDSTDTYIKETIDYKSLKILYHLGYSSQEIITDNFLSDLVFKHKDSSFYASNIDDLCDPEYVKILKENTGFFKHVISDFMIAKFMREKHISEHGSGEEKYFSEIFSETIHVIDQIIKTKITINTIFSVDIKLTPGITDKTIKELYKALIKATNHTGYIYPSKAFLNRIKKSFGPKTKISIHRNGGKDLVNDLFPDFKLSDSINSFLIDSNPSPKAKIRLIISDKKTKVALTIDEKNFDWRTIEYTGLKKELNKNPLTNKIIKLSNRYTRNKNILKYVGFKAAYSKKVFEEILKEKSLNTFDLREKVLYL